MDPGRGPIPTPMVEPSVIDPRYDPDYGQFYQEYSGQRKLPPPLDSTRSLYQELPGLLHQHGARLGAGGHPLGPGGSSLMKPGMGGGRGVPCGAACSSAVLHLLHHSGLPSSPYPLCLHLLQGWK